jgi:Flp pilus assembly pilin Flp
MWPLLKRFVADEGAQDVVEYALLTAVIGLAGAAAWPLLMDALRDGYRRSDANTQDLWEPPPPSK